MSDADIGGVFDELPSERAAVAPEVLPVRRLTRLSTSKAADVEDAYACRLGAG